MRYGNIANTILKRQDTNKNETLRTNFHTFFESDLFLINPKLNNREQILHYLCEILKQKEYADKDSLPKQKPDIPGVFRLTSMPPAAKGRQKTALVVYGKDNGNRFYIIYVKY